MPRKLRLVPIAVAVAVATAGCGSSSTSTSGKTKFVAEADTICQQTLAKRTAANSEVSKVSSSTAKTLAVLARVAPPVAADEHHAITLLRALKAPASLNSDWRQLLAGMEVLATDATQIGEHAKAHDYKAIVSLTASGRKVRETLIPIASRDGFAYCGRTS
ncbi:MAG: hypothetical protein ABR992_13510 [Solirubrobacteraceae bacterium]|jgi:hypothetical protein